MITKKIPLLLSLIIAFTSGIHAKRSSLKDLPKENLLTIENQTGHRLFIIEDRSFKKLEPQQAVTLYWDEPISEISSHTIRVYYGANIKNGTPNIRPKSQRRPKTRRTKTKMASRKASKPSDPLMIAKIKTNQPGTLTLFYDTDGVLRLERIG